MIQITWQDCTNIKYEGASQLMYKKKTNLECFSKKKLHLVGKNIVINNMTFFFF